MKPSERIKEIIESGDIKEYRFIIKGSKVNYCPGVVTCGILQYLDEQALSD